MIPPNYQTYKALHSVHSNKNRYLNIGDKITVGNQENQTSGTVVGAYINNNNLTKILLANTSACGWNGANQRMYGGKNKKKEVIEVDANEIIWEMLGYYNNAQFNY